MIDISFFQKIYLENIWFINTFAFGGINIQNGNASNAVMKSIRVENMELNDIFLVLNSLDSYMTINDIVFSSLSLTKSKI